MSEQLIALTSGLFQDQALWGKVYFGNALQNYATSAVLFVGLFALFAIFRGVLILRLRTLAKKTKTDIDDVAIRVIDTLRPSFYGFVALYFAIQALIFPDIVQKIASGVLLIWIVYQAIRAARVLAEFLIEKSIKEEDERVRKHKAGTVGKLLNIGLWALGALLILQNLGINITSLVAGLGIGGIAIALAAQNILGDLFSSFAINFDKPFVEGDFIKVGDKSGTVEKIGIKTTRVRSSQGEEIVMANTALTSATIQNFKKMQKRRGEFSFGVTYETPSEKLKKIPEIVTEIIDKTENTEPFRVHFMRFDDSALGFDVQYYITSADYDEYLDAQEQINLLIVEAFEKERIEMAYPTRTIYMHKANG